MQSVVHLRKTHRLQHLHLESTLLSARLGSSTVFLVVWHPRLSQRSVKRPASDTKSSCIQLADIWSRPHALAISILFYAVGYAMCAGAKNVATVVAGQFVYTIGNTGITFCKTIRPEESVDDSELDPYCRHYLPPVASVRKRRSQPPLRRECVCRWLHLGWDLCLQRRRLAMGGKYHYLELLKSR